MATKTVKVLGLKPGELPELWIIENTLEALQRCVGGYVEAHQIGDLTLLCNEDGCQLGLAPNRVIVGNLYRGTVVLIKTGKSGNTVSMTQKAIREGMLIFGYRYNDKD